MAFGLAIRGSAVASPASPASPGTDKRPVLAGCELDYPPYCLVTTDRQADGFSVELLRAALTAVGRQVTFKIGPWPEIKQDLADGRIQALPLVGRTPEREAVFDFTFPYLTMHGTIVVRQDTVGIRGPADLKGKRVAVLQGDNAEEYLRRAALGAVIVPLPSFEAALRELSNGKHDAVVIQKLVAFQLMKRAGLTNLRTVGPPLTDFTQTFCFAVRKGDSSLLAALNEGLALVIADGTFRRLSATWFSPIETTEQTRSHIVVGGDSNFPPYEFLDSNGQPAGFNVDLTRAIARKMGMHVEVLLGPWAEVRRGLEAGEIDAVEGMFYSPERDRAFDFSPQYSNVQHSIVVRHGSVMPNDLASLAGKSVLVMAGDVMHDLIRDRAPESKVVAVATQEEALRQLAEGHHDCALVAKIPAHYWIKKNGWRNLWISERPVFSAEYCYAVPAGREESLALFSEGLAALTLSGEFRTIQAKWLGPYEEPKLTLRDVAGYVGVPILLLLAVLAGSIAWSRSLRRQVINRTAELTAEINERETAEKALKSSEIRFQTLAECAPVGIFSTDVTGATTYVNPRWCAIAQLPQDQAMGDGWLAALHPDDRDALVQGWQSATAERAPSRAEYRFVHADGSVAWVLGDAVPELDGHGNFVGYIGTITDITERRQIEETLRASEETIRQVQKMEAIGNLAGGVAHDFNNLLQAMLSQTQALRGRTFDPHEMAAHVVELEQQIRHGAALTRQLLLFSRRETIKRERLDLNEVIRDTMQLVQRLIRANISLRVEPADGIPPVRADRGQLQQVLMNLAVNASDAMPAGGCLTIRTGEDSAGGVWIEVSDTGTGIPEGVRPRIFEPFFTTKAAGTGTGLGLSVVHGIVTQHGGTIEFDTLADRGTTFRITLPVAVSGGYEEVPEEPAMASEPEQGHGERILVVEDEEGAREGLRDLLRMLGYEVLAAVESGEDALRLPLSPSPDLLLTDFMLPGITGPEVATTLVERWPGLSVILMSGYTRDEAVRRSVAVGHIRYLQKPFGMDLLARELRAALDDSISPR